MPKQPALEDKVVRCLSLLFAMARARRGVQLRQLYERRGWYWRSAYRDVETLEAAGVPVEKRERGWFALDEAWLPPSTVDLRADEGEAVATARRLASVLRDTSLGGALERLLAKLGVIVRQGELPLADTWLHTREPPSLAAHRVAFDLLRDAIAARRPVSFHYSRANGDTSQREVEPLLFHWDGTIDSFYLVGWCRTREALRTFALQRIDRVRVLEGYALARPEAVRQASLAYRGWLRPESTRVAIRFSPEVAREVRERSWHASQRFDDQPDGGVVLELAIGAAEAIERDIMSFGPDATVLTPDTLAERIRMRHLAAARPTSAAG